MKKQIILIVFFFYFLILFETGFMANFPAIISLVAVSVAIITLFEPPKSPYAVVGAIAGGFFWDVFSSSFFGFHILIMLILVGAMKVILNYVRIPIIKRFKK